MGYAISSTVSTRFFSFSRRWLDPIFVFLVWLCFVLMSWFRFMFMFMFRVFYIKFLRASVVIEVESDRFFKGRQSRPLRINLLLRFHSYLLRNVKSLSFNWNLPNPIRKTITIPCQQCDLFLSCTMSDLHCAKHIEIYLKLHGFSTSINDRDYRDIIEQMNVTKLATLVFFSSHYEYDEERSIDVQYIFKQQFPIIIILGRSDLKPTKDWFRFIYDRATDLLVLTEDDFKQRLLDKIQRIKQGEPILSNWLIPLHSSRAMNILTDRSSRFIGTIKEWSVAYHNAAFISRIFRTQIRDPLRIETNVKLNNFFQYYVKEYVNTKDHGYFWQANLNNDVQHLARAYTSSSTSFSNILNQQLASNILSYFERTLILDVDYRLVKCLIDFVALFIYRSEFEEYIYRSGTVYRGLVLTEQDLYQYVVGSHIINTTFLSTSRERQVAVVFAGEDHQLLSVLCIYVIEHRYQKRIALDISRLSNIPDEKEIILLPLSAFRVSKVLRSNDAAHGRQGMVEILLIEDEENNNQEEEYITYLWIIILSFLFSLKYFFPYYNRTIWKTMKYANLIPTTDFSWM